MRKSIIYYSTTVLFAIYTTVLCTNLNDDLTLTYGEKQVMDKFKQRVRSILPHRYMREETYLVNWLRAKDFNVIQAEIFLKKNLIWRKQNNVDKIREEDFSELHDEYPFHIDTFGKNGSPVLTIVAADWDIRKAVLFRIQHILRRQVIKMYEEASVKVRESQLAGINVTRFHMLWNLKGFSLALHGCPICIMEIRSYFQIYENYFPGMADKIVMFNAPRQVQIVRPLVRELLSGQTLSRIHFYGTNKSEWQRTLLQFIDADQLTEVFGGTRSRQVKEKLNKISSKMEMGGDNSQIFFSF